jgi:hypothetical protein
VAELDLVCRKHLFELTLAVLLTKHFLRYGVIFTVSNFSF